MQTGKEPLVAEGAENKAEGNKKRGALYRGPGGEGQGMVVSTSYTFTLVVISC